jgi:hypothetical protein
MERIPVPPGHSVYRLNICEVTGHAGCPGVGVLSVGKLELGPVACNCECHKKPKMEN